jgi:hypothetical protein
MSRMTRAGLLAGTAALTLTGVGVASPAADATQDQLRAQIEKLNARVAELEGRNNGQWLNEQRAAEVRSLVQDVLADADTRASLLGTGMQGGYDNGFVLGSTDGNFLLRMNGQLQTRFMYNRLDSPPAGADKHRWGFENARTKLWFSGHVVNPQWQYLIETDFSRLIDPDDEETSVQLLDAYLAHDYGTGFMMTMGQFKLPFLREQLVDARYQLAVERSLVHELYTLGRSQGLMAAWDSGFFRLWGAISDGMQTTGSPALAYDTEWAFTVRGEALLGGDWGQFDEFRSVPGEVAGILVGAAFHWQRDEHGTPGMTIDETMRFTADATAKFEGVNLFGAYIFNHTDRRGAGNWQDHAVVVQGGVAFAPEWDVFGRYERTWFDSDNPLGANLSILTAGVNNYFYGQQGKWTTDIGYAFRAMDFGSNRTGWRVDEGKGQIVLRTQLQLLF